MTIHPLAVGCLLVIAATLAPAWAHTPVHTRGAQPDHGNRGHAGVERPSRPDARRGQGLRARGGDLAVGRLDRDGDGRVSRHELELTGAGEGRQAALAQRLLHHFAAIDVDGDGAITRGEYIAWQAGTRTQREAARAQQARQRFVQADLNGDGHLSRVEVAEAMPHLVAAFAWLDSNGDGVLSASELQRQGAD